MTYLLAGLLALICAWFLASPLRKANHVSAPQATVEDVLRDRLLNQLQAIDEEYADGRIEESGYNDEQRRIEAELATVLHGGENTSTDELSPITHSKGTWIASLIIFALALPLLSGGLYLFMQLPTLSKISAQQTAQATQSAPKALPPEVLAMVAKLEQKLQQEPDNGEGWKMLGRSYAVMARYEDAAKAYTRAKQLLPNDADVDRALQQLTELAQSQSNQPTGQQILNMVAQLEDKLKQNPDNLDGWIRLGRSYLVLKRPNDALHAWSTAYELEPKKAQVLLGYAQAVLTVDQQDAEGLAASLYDQLYQLDPENLSALWFKGVMAYQEKQFENAISFWKKALAILPADHPDVETVNRALKDAQSELDKGVGAESIDRKAVR